MANTHKTGAEIRAMMTTPTPRNKPIEQLLAEYEAEGCNHANTQGVIDAAFRYVSTMEDCQVRCLLYVLARDLTAAQSEIALLEKVYEHAYGMSCGVDWNHGTHSKHHRAKLISAVEAYRAAHPKEGT